MTEPGGEPPHAQGDDLRAGLARPGAVGVAAEQDAVAREVRGDVLEAEARFRELQPPLLVEPQGEVLADDGGLHPLAPDKLPEPFQALVGVARVHRRDFPFVRVDEYRLHSIVLLTVPRVSRCG